MREVMGGASNTSYLATMTEPPVCKNEQCYSSNSIRR